MPDNARKELIDGLNEDLKGEFAAIIMYRLYASMVQGPYRQELRTFFANEIPEELAHAQMLADKISALGGTPAATPSPVKGRLGREGHARGGSASRARDDRALRQTAETG